MRLEHVWGRRTSSSCSRLVSSAQRESAIQVTAVIGCWSPYSALPTLRRRFACCANLTVCPAAARVDLEAMAIRHLGWSSGKYVWIMTIYYHLRILRIIEAVAQWQSIRLQCLDILGSRVRTTAASLFGFPPLYVPLIRYLNILFSTSYPHST